MKNYTPAGEGSPIVTQYNYATGEYMRPNYYNGQDIGGLEEQINNRNTRMGRKGYAPVPNYMVGTGNSPMHRGGNNLMPSPQQGFQYLTSGGYPPPSAMPQNANVFPAMFNHQTGQRIDPQSGGLVPYAPMVDKHSTGEQLEPNVFAGTPSYLSKTANVGAYGSAMPYRDVNGKGGYRYRQFADGSIQILAGKQGVGTMISKSSPYWQPITDEIGEYPTATPQSQQSQLLQQGQAFAQSEQGQSVLTALFDRFVSGQSAKTEQQRLLAEQAKLEQQKIAQQMQPSVFEKSKPYLIGLAGIVAVGTTVYLVTKPKSKK